MTRGQRFAVMLRIPEMGVMLAVLLLAGIICVNAQTCGVDSTDPENMNCGPGSTDTYTTTTDSTVKAGLSYDFYQNTCPTIRTVIDTMVAEAVKEQSSQIPGLVRLAFHDCFIQGCDASVLLNTSSDGEQQAIPNKSLRPESVELIASIKEKLEQLCPHTVSCADIVAGAGAAVLKEGKGPVVTVPFGRRDSTTFQTSDFVTNNLPSPFNSVAKNLAIFQSFGLDLSDMVTLGGAHTLGRAHCGSFANRLTPKVDPELDPTLASSLKSICPDGINSPNFVQMDPSTPFILDNKFFRGLLVKKGVLKSDALLVDEPDTKAWVQKFGADNSLFLSWFKDSFIKLSQVNVLTGNDGQVRTICNETNAQWS